MLISNEHLKLDKIAMQKENKQTHNSQITEMELN